MEGEECGCLSMGLRPGNEVGLRSLLKGGGGHIDLASVFRETIVALCGMKFGQVFGK